MTHAGPPVPPLPAGTLIPVEELVEADPKRPNKALAAAAAATLTALLGQYATNLPPWATAIISLGIVFLTAYVTPNPLRRKPPRHARR